MKLDLGAGQFPKEGFTPIDLGSLCPGAIHYNLECGLPLDIEHDSVEEINANNTLEHIRNLTGLMNACWDALKRGSAMTIEVPLFPHVSAMKDPTHVRYFVPESFDYFDRDWDYPRQPDYGIKKWHVESKKVRDDGGGYVYLEVRLIKPTV